MCEHHRYVYLRGKGTGSCIRLTDDQQVVKLIGRIERRLRALPDAPHKRGVHVEPIPES